MPIRYTALPTSEVRTAQAGAADAYGAAPERAISSGSGIPCRHCLKDVPEGRPYLILACRPFDGLNPYTETGPIFLCADPCARGDCEAAPEILASPDYIVRGYDADERIIYGTGGVVATEAIPARAEALLADPQVSFVHIRSSRNNCFQVRVDRA